LTANDGDFVSRCVDLFNEQSNGIKLRTQDVKEDIREYYKRNNISWDIAQKMIVSEGFCASFVPNPEAQKTIQKLKSEGVKVKYITAPYISAKYWMFERWEWLRDNFDCDHNDIIIARDKTPCSSCLTLVDDKLENAQDWESHNSDAILFAQPWNEKVGMKFSQRSGTCSVHSDPLIANEV